MRSGLATVLDQALRAAGIPIEGVSIGSETDRATWRPQFKPEATAAHRTQAAAVITALRVDDAALLEAEAQAFDDDKVIKALVVWCAQKFAITPAQAKTQIIAIYKALA